MRGEYMGDLTTMSTSPPPIIKKGLFSSVDKIRLIIGSVITAVLALSVHAVLLQVFNAPYPSEPIGGAIPGALNYAVLAGGAMWLARCMNGRLPGRNASTRAGILFLLLCGLNETVRDWFMNAWCYGSPAGHWISMALTEIPTTLPYLAIAAGTTILSERVERASRQWLGATVLGLAAGIALPPVSAWMQDGITAALPLWLPADPWCQMPYGPSVLIPAYASFVEPALACLFCVALAWPALPQRTSRRLLAFTLLVLTLKKQLLMPFIYVIYASIPPLTALASMGQFTLEAAALGFFMALAWRHASSRSLKA